MSYLSGGSEHLVQLPVELILFPIRMLKKKKKEKEKCGGRGRKQRIASFASIYSLDWLNNIINYVLRELKGVAG